MRQRIWLVKNGIPFDVAFAVDAATSSAWAIMFQEFEGAEFDLHTMRFKDRK
jgi:hypothetical protein